MPSVFSSSRQATTRQPMQNKHGNLHASTLLVALPPCSPKTEEISNGCTLSLVKEEMQTRIQTHNGSNLWEAEQHHKKSNEGKKHTSLFSPLEIFLRFSRCSAVLHSAEKIGYQERHMKAMKLAVACLGQTWSVLEKTAGRPEKEGGRKGVSRSDGASDILATGQTDGKQGTTLHSQNALLLPALCLTFSSLCLRECDSFSQAGLRAEPPTASWTFSDDAVLLSYLRTTQVG